MTHEQKMKKRKTKNRTKGRDVGASPPKKKKKEKKAEGVGGWPYRPLEGVDGSSHPPMPTSK